MNDKFLTIFKALGAYYADDGDKFRGAAYNKAVTIIEALPYEITTDTDFSAMRGIGKGLQEKIQEILATGTCDKYESLKNEMPPPSVEELKRIPGVGPKKAKKLWKEQGITSLAEMKKAIDDGKITDTKMINGVEFALKASERLPLGKAEFIVAPIFNKIAATKGVQRIEFAGSFRRRKETVKDIDILLTTTDKPALHATLAQLGFSTADGETKSRIFVDGLQVDVMMVPPEEYEAALLYFTGSKEFNVFVRKLAIAKGLKLNEKGLWKDDKCVARKSEAEMLEAVGLFYVPPELREESWL